MAFLGGSFAPPLSDELLKSYAKLAAALEPSRVKSDLEALLAPAVQWWALPESNTAVQVHGHGMLFQALAPDIAKALYDALPWDEDLEHETGGRSTLGGVFDNLGVELCRQDGETIEAYAARRAAFTPAAQQQLAVRDAGTHLLWFSKELGLRNREPLTADLIRFAPGPDGKPIVAGLKAMSLMALIAGGGLAAYGLLSGDWSPLMWLPLFGTLRSSVTSRNAAVDAMFPLLNSGTIKFYTNAQVGTFGGSEAGNTLLATCTFASTAESGSASSGVGTAAAITSDTNAAASGTAGHGLLSTSGAALRHDASCGQGSGDFNFDNSSIVAGGTVAVSSLTLTQPQ
jgi:hypothetical protein